MKLRNGWLGLMAGSILAFSVTACDPGAVDPENPMPVYQSEVVETNSFDLLVQTADVQDATLEQEMRERPDQRGGDDRRGPKVMHPFARLLNALKLTEEQRPLVADLLAQHRSCVEEAMALLREASAAIMRRANAARQDVLARLEAGEIDRATARQEIRQINQAAREALKNLPARERVREMMKSCDETFIAGLRDVLTDEQEVLLDRWLAARPTR